MVKEYVNSKKDLREKLIQRFQTIKENKRSLEGKGIEKELEDAAVYLYKEKYIPYQVIADFYRMSNTKMKELIEKYVKIEKRPRYEISNYIPNEKINFATLLTLNENDEEYEEHCIRKNNLAKEKSKNENNSTQIFPCLSAQEKKQFIKEYFEKPENEDKKNDLDKRRKELEQRTNTEGHLELTEKMKDALGELYKLGIPHSYIARYMGVIKEKALEILRKECKVEIRDSTLRKQKAKLKKNFQNSNLKSSRQKQKAIFDPFCMDIPSSSTSNKNPTKKYGKIRKLSEIMNINENNKREVKKQNSQAENSAIEMEKENNQAENTREMEKENNQEENTREMEKANSAPVMLFGVNLKSSWNDKRDETKQ